MLRFGTHPASDAKLDPSPESLTYPFSHGLRKFRTDGKRIFAEIEHKVRSNKALKKLVGPAGLEPATTPL